MDVCDPDAKMKNIRKLIKLHTGRSVKLSRDKTCDIIRDTKSGNLPLPPLVLTRDKKYLLDDKSPLKQKDYELLFRSDTKSSVMKRLAKKVGLVEVDKTKVELKRAIGRRLASMNVREPILLPGGRRGKRVTFSDEIEENIKSDSESEIETNENNSARNANASANTRENNSARNANASANTRENNSARNASTNALVSNKELRSTLAKKRHMDRLKALSKVKTSSSSVSSSANTRVVENAQRKIINAQKAVRNAERETRLRVHEAETRGTLQRRRARRIMENTIRRSRIETNNALNRARRERRERDILNRDARKAERELYREREMALRYKRDFQNIRKQEKKLRENLNRQISMTENQISAIKADTRKMLTKQKVVSGLKSLAAKKQIDEAVKSAENLQKSLNNTKQNLEKTRFEQESAIKQVKELEEKLKSSVNVNSQVKLRKELENAKSKIANLEERQKTAASNLQTEAKKFDFLKMKYEAAKTQMNTNALAIKKAAENRNAAIAAASEKAKAELNEIRREKEKALEEAAANKAKAIEEAKNAAKKAAMANTQMERNQAKRNIENAQAKIRAANANKAQALADAKVERNAALAAAKKSENEARKALVASRFQSAAQKARADQALKNAEEKRLRNISAQKIQNAIRARKAQANEMRRVREDAKRKIQNAQRRSTINKPNTRGNTLQKKETTNLKNRENRERRQREIQLQKQKNALEVREREKKERERKMAELKAAANAKAAENAKMAAEAREMERKKRNFDTRLSKESILTNNNKTELRARGTFNVRNIEQIKRVRMANVAKKMEMEKKRREQDKQREQRKKALLNVEKQLERATNLTEGNKDELKKRFFRGELKPDDIGKRREQRRFEKYVQNATLLPPTRKKTYMEDIRKPGTNLQSLRALLNAEIRLRSKRSNSKPVMKNNPLFQPNMKNNPILSLKRELHDLIEIKFPMKSDGCKRGKKGLHDIVKNANTKQELEDLKKPTSAFMKSITRRERQGWCQERPKWR